MLEEGTLPPGFAVKKRRLIALDADGNVIGPVKKKSKKKKKKAKQAKEAKKAKAAARLAA